MWGRTLLAALAVLIAFFVLRGPVESMIGGLIDRMAVSVPIEEPDVNELVLRLGPEDAPLEFGSRDDTNDGPIDALQRMLALLGFDPGAPDGLYGGGTEEAVRLFQQGQIGLDATGVADEVTITVLLRVFSGSAASAITDEQLLEDVLPTEGPQGTPTTAVDDFDTPTEPVEGGEVDPGFDEGVVDEGDIGFEDVPDGDVPEGEVPDVTIVEGEG